MIILLRPYIHPLGFKLFKIVSDKSEYILLEVCQSFIIKQIDFLLVYSNLFQSYDYQITLYESRLCDGFNID